MTHGVTPGPAATPAPAPAPAQASRAYAESKWVVRGVSVVLIVVLGVIGYGLYQKGGTFLYQLQETAVSRGLITFLVAVVTVSIALVVAVWVVASNADGETLKARFSYAKDILATLVGILGTILGFYFGSAERSATETLALAELQFRSGQLIAHVSGGTPPFRFSIAGLEGDVRTTARVSKDGWLFEPVPPSLKTGTPITVEAIDAKDRKASRTSKYQGEERDASPSQGPPPRSGQGTTQPQQPAGAASR